MVADITAIVGKVSYDISIKKTWTNKIFFKTRV